jgi:hypothetical protein
MLIWVFFYCNFYNISNRLVSIDENRQKVLESRQRTAEMPPSAAPMLGKKGENGGRMEKYK